MRQRRTVLAVIAAIVASASPAPADDLRAIVDQVIVEPSVLTGSRLTVTLSLLTLQGGVVDIAEPDSLRLMIGGRRDYPFALGRYGATRADTAIVIAIQSSVTFAGALPVVVDALDSQLLAPLAASPAGERARIAVISFGDSSTAGKLAPIKAARAQLAAVGSDESVGDPLLLDTVERALTILRRAKTAPEGRPIRKMVIVVADGRDATFNRDRVTQLGLRAARDGVAIHSLAHSPTDARRSLLALGELSKQSRGTFRWVRTPESWTPNLAQLGDELLKQHVVTFFVPRDEELSGKLHIELVGRTTVNSSERAIPQAGCNGVSCEPGAYCAADQCVMPLAAPRRGVIGWILLIGGIVVGSLIALGAIGFVITKRQERAAVAPPLATGPMTNPASALPASALPASALPGSAPASAPPGVARIPANLATGPRLIVTVGPLAGRQFAVRHGMMIGNASDCDIAIQDGYTSSHHAQLALDDRGQCKIYDRGSTNGTYVNGVKVTAERTLEHGCLVRIGSTELWFLAQ